MLRLGKHLTLTEKKIYLTPQVDTTLKLFGSEFDTVVIVDLNLTANLLVALSNNALVNSDQQTVYEWLAVAQTFIRAQL
jgi:hypothetical protein